MVAAQRQLVAADVPGLGSDWRTRLASSSDIAPRCLTRRSLSATRAAGLPWATERVRGGGRPSDGTCLGAGASMLYEVEAVEEDIALGDLGPAEAVGLLSARVRDLVRSGWTRPGTRR